MTTLAEMVNKRYNYAKCAGIEIPPSEDLQIRKLINILDRNYFYVYNEIFDYIFGICKKIDKSIEQKKNVNTVFLFFVIKTKFESALQKGEKT